MRHKGSFLPASPRRQAFTSLTLPQIDIEVLHVNSHWIVINKPAGILSVPGRHTGPSLAVSEQVAQRFPKTGEALVVHRLDLPTSGLMLFALHTDALKALQALFAQRHIHKRYTALLSKTLNHTQGEIFLPLRLDPYQRPLQVYDPVHGKACHTSWEVINQDSQHTRVYLYPHTGRTHQLRVHMAHPLGLNAPIIGDALYHPHAPEAAIPKERLCLHASLLQFTDPFTQQVQRFELPAPF
jgi:tRNA pseudouridine32 synthase / 23S rRNA pseudouridine746 synthase